MVKVTTTEGIIGWVNALHCRFRSTPQYVAGCLEMMKIFFAPALNRVAEFRAEEVLFILKPFLGAQMAKAALETAIWMPNLGAQEFCWRNLSTQLNPRLSVASPWVSHPP